MTAGVAAKPAVRQRLVQLAFTRFTREQVCESGHRFVFNCTAQGKLVGGAM
jgi:hypothetical protein